MPANINSMFYYGDKPWHKLGVEVEKALTSAEAIEAAGLNWEVKKTPVYFQHGRKYQRVNGRYVTVRQDNQVPLGSVGQVYQVLQNREAFSFFDAVVGVKEAMYHTAGALGAGERVWLLAKLPGYIKTKGDDVTEKFLLLANAHDGSGAVQVMFTPIRVVCQNTLNMAIESASNRVAIRHTTGMTTKMESVQEDLGIINNKFALLETISQQMAKRYFKKADLESYIKKSGLIPNKEENTPRANNIMEEVSRLFETGKGANLPSAKGTMWGAFNAVVEYVDHVRNKDSGERAESLLFGSGAQIKQRAFNTALELVKP